jgi:membrane-bound lytic murein transglycosylase F
VRPWIRHRGWLAWTKIAVACAAAGLLGTCSQPPSLLAQIKKLGELRVVTRNSPNAFYSGADDEPEGPEYEFARRFASDLGVKLRVTPMRKFADIYSALDLGHADIAAAALSVPEHGADEIDYGPVYQRLRAHLIYRKGHFKPRSLAEIGNSQLEVAAGSSPAHLLQDARVGLPTLVWVENANTASVELMERVASGDIDYTIADSNEFALAHDAHPDLAVAFDFPGVQSLAWAFSSRDDSVLNEARMFFARMVLAGELSAVIKRYYGRAQDLQFVGARAFMRHIQARLPQYRGWFEQAAGEYSEDWRLLAAIAYQESKWDPTASSLNGALGLMQLTERSAIQAKVHNRGDPRENIFGGARYFKLVRAQIPVHVPEPDRTWFALAAYNTGYGHLEDARIMTQAAGRDPDSWQDVREYLPLLSQERWYTQAENGYARGWEPVRYVDNVRGYRDLLEWIIPAPVGSNHLAAIPGN